MKKLSHPANDLRTMISTIVNLQNNNVVFFSHLPLALSGKNVDGQLF